MVLNLLVNFALDGHLRPVSGILPLMACQQARHRLLVPTNNLEEANQLPAVWSLCSHHLQDVMCTLLGNFIYQHHPTWKFNHLRVSIWSCRCQVSYVPAVRWLLRRVDTLFFKGPPGTGKTLPASATLYFATIQCPRKFRSRQYLLGCKCSTYFRANAPSVHHTILRQAIALVGGGSQPKTRRN